ncbi:hypothetical protein [Antrihabitans sp. YC2-6]|uniref:hypothetical protein n=1 Tax=Antrihabitans sp. YC2-6 TaxID=2799498 RepID=UPI0018F60757|nr:hypothetical protein [Antrihabitans sp. YC2-6]MBJ8347012.1 hypothetical protein [Antrihabitans sp. YC2-6]
MVSKWSVRAVVSSPTNLDGLSIRPTTGSDPTLAAERLCTLLPAADSPFGDVYIVATPVEDSDKKDSKRRDWITERTIVCPVFRRGTRRQWAPGAWALASKHPKFRETSTSAVPNEKTEDGK